jgi:hypothetical protein
MSQQVLSIKEMDLHKYIIEGPLLLRHLVARTHHSIGILLVILLVILLTILLATNSSIDILLAVNSSSINILLAVTRLEARPLLNLQMHLQQYQPCRIQYHQIHLCYLQELFGKLLLMHIPVVSFILKPYSY